MKRRTPSHETNDRKSGEPRRRGTVSTKQILEQPVMDMNGVSFGRVSEVVLEVERGMAAYVLIDCVDDSKCALPFNMLHIESNPMRLHAKVHRDVFLRGTAGQGPVKKPYRSDVIDSYERKNNATHDS